MKIIYILFSVLQFLNICKESIAWDNEELEVFDVVEEVNQNFYELLNVPKVFQYISMINHSLN